MAVNKRFNQGAMLAVAIQVLTVMRIKGRMPPVFGEQTMITENRG